MSDACDVNGRTILVVDDEPAVRDIVVRALRASGHIVYAAPGGGDALRLADHLGDSIDLLITDLVMRGMNGKALAQQFRTRFPRMPILFMSGFMLEQLDLQPEAMQASFMEKPFSPAELRARVEEMLSTHCGCGEITEIPAST